MEGWGREPVVVGGRGVLVTWAGVWWWVWVGREGSSAWMAAERRRRRFQVYGAS